jgi:hypothetical protein
VELGLLRGGHAAPTSASLEGVFSPTTRDGFIGLWPDLRAMGRRPRGAQRPYSPRPSEVIRYVAAPASCGPAPGFASRLGEPSAERQWETGHSNRAPAFASRTVRLRRAGCAQKGRSGRSQQPRAPPHPGRLTAGTRPPSGCLAEERTRRRVSRTAVGGGPPIRSQKMVGLVTHHAGFGRITSSSRGLPPVPRLSGANSRRSVLASERAASVGPSRGPDFLWPVASRASSWRMLRTRLSRRPPPLAQLGHVGGWRRWKSRSTVRVMSKRRQAERDREGASSRGERPFESREESPPDAKIV